MASQLSVREELERLSFHDSAFRGIELLFSQRGGPDRGCRLYIDYYDWEGTKPDRRMIRRQSGSGRLSQLSLAT